VRVTRALLYAATCLLVVASALPPGQRLTVPGAAGSRESAPVRVPAARTRPPLPDGATGQLTLTFVGDIMAHRPNYLMPDYNRIYDAVRNAFLSDDLTFANLEFPVDPTRPYSTYPHFNVHPEYVRAAVRAGVDVFSLANNHATDQEAEGVLETLSSLGNIVKIYAERGGAVAGRPRRLYFSGLRPARVTQYSATLIRRDGWRIGFIALTQFVNDPRPGDGSDRVNVLDYRDRAATERFLRWVRLVSPNYDLFVVSYHGGVEYQTRPDPRKVAFFEALLQRGCDIVWAHHPHVLQPWHTVWLPDGRRGLILYSTGNFISGQTWFLTPEDHDARRAFTGDTALFKVTVTRSGTRGSVTDVETTLLAAYRDPADGIVVRPLAELAREDKSAWGAYYSERLAAMKRLVQ